MFADHTILMMTTLLMEVPAVLSKLGGVLLMIAGFSVVVFVHELGHFLVAKWAGVRVDKFCVGFGKELFGFTRGGTRYAFNALPVGGYVKMLGQEDFAVDKDGDWQFKKDPDSFANKPVRVRMVIVSAGVVMNLVFAAVAFMIVYTVGLPSLAPVVGLFPQAARRIWPGSKWAIGFWPSTARGYRGSRASRWLPSWPSRMKP